MLYREEALGVFEVFNILRLLLTHQHVFCFKLKFYDSIEACCDESCSDVFLFIRSQKEVS